MISVRRLGLNKSQLEKKRKSVTSIVNVWHFHSKSAFLTFHKTVKLFYDIPITYSYSFPPNVVEKSVAIVSFFLSDFVSNHNSRRICKFNFSHCYFNGCHLGTSECQTCCSHPLFCLAVHDKFVQQLIWCYLNFSYIKTCNKFDRRLYITHILR